MRSIDELMADYLSGESLSAEESENLKIYLQQHKHKTFYHHIETMTDREAYSRIQHRKEKAFDRIRMEIVRQQKRQKRPVSVYSGMSAAACVLLMIGLLYFLKPDSTVSSEEWVSESLIKPGEARAELKLADGKIIFLDAATDALIVVDSTLNIRNNDKTLVYAGGDVKREKEYNVLTVPSGGEYNLLLADGTKVYLNSGSELRYPVTFTEGPREVFLFGEAYFEVKEDASRPFIVQADPFSIRVTGTSFNVKAYPGQDFAAATLEEGKVEVLCGKETYKMFPGMQVAYHRQTATSECKQVDTELYTSWKDGYYYFQDMTLDEIMTTLALWYDLNVFYEHAAAKDIVFGGRLKRYDNVNYLLKKFEETNEIEFLIKEKNIVIRKK